MQVTFIERPDQLPPVPSEGRVVLIDVAFAAEADFAKSTAPALRRLVSEDRLALWIDHHDHPAWSEWSTDARFVLASKLVARACPQLVTSEVVARAGVVDHVWAHGDFDGCMAAAKFVRGGMAPYAEADEDARFADAPGKGFRCSERGKRALDALDQALATDRTAYAGLLGELHAAWVHGVESDELLRKLDALGRDLALRRARLQPIVDSARELCPGVLLVVHDGLTGPDKKFVLRELEERATVGIVFSGGWSTAATFDDERLDLRALPGVAGMRGYVWGQVRPETLVAGLVGRGAWGVGRAVS